MTIYDVLVAAPWTIFGAALAVICIRLASARHATRRQSRRPGQQPAADPAAPRPGPAGHEPASCPDTPEEQ